MKVITAWDYVFMFLAGMIGITIHVLIKIKGIRKRNPKAGIKEVFGLYFQMDWDSLLLSFVTVLGCMFIINEFLFTKDFENIDTAKEFGWKYKMVNWIRTVFIVIGYAAQSLIYASLGRAEKVLHERAKSDGVVLPEQEQN